MSHAANPDLLNRLKRAQGHLAKIVEMVAEGRDGLQIAQQMQAVVAALDKTKTLLVSDHIEHHLEELVGCGTQRRVTADPGRGAWHAGRAAKLS